MIRGKEHYDLLTRDVQQDQKLLFLASRVHTAEQTTKNDPNKRVLMPFSLDGDTQKKLAAVAKLLSLSRANTLTLLIDREYKRLFPSKST